MRNAMSRLMMCAATTATLVGIGGTASADLGDQLFKLLPDDGAAVDRFGQSIALSGNIAIVGAFADDDMGDESGAAYLFDVTTGLQTAKIVPADGEEKERFGYAVAIDGNIAVIGAYRDNDNGTSSGSAYVYDVTDPASPTFLHKLLADDGASQDYFGFSVGLGGGVAIVGAYQDDDMGSSSGSVYLFDASNGSQITKITVADGAVQDFFGYSVGIKHDRAIVGAFGDDDNGDQSGSAYLYDLSVPSTPVLLDKIVPSDGANAERFGWSVAMGTDTCIVGAYKDDDLGSDSGSAYLFDADTGHEIIKFLANDGTANDSFGHSVSIDGDPGRERAIVGALTKANMGAAYIYDATHGTLEAKLLADDRAGGDQFGSAVAISGTLAVIGADADDDNGTMSGSAYVFDADVPCLRLDVENLVAGERAIFTITKGTPGARAVTVYGTQAGQTGVNNFAGYCATFGIKGVKESKVIGGLNRSFDADGVIAFALKIPGNVSGLNILFQAAMRGTCPDECVSNLLSETVQ